MQHWLLGKVIHEKLVNVLGFYKAIVMLPQFTLERRKLANQLFGIFILFFSAELCELLKVHSFRYCESVVSL